MVLENARRMQFTRIKFLKGGLAAWKEKGYPVERYDKAFHLEYGGVSRIELQNPGSFNRLRTGSSDCALAIKLREASLRMTLHLWNQGLGSECQSTVTSRWVEWLGVRAFFFHAPTIAPMSMRSRRVRSLR